MMKESSQIQSAPEPEFLRQSRRDFLFRSILAGAAVTTKGVQDVLNNNRKETARKHLREADVVLCNFVPNRHLPPSRRIAMVMNAIRSLEQDREVLKPSDELRREINEMILKLLDAVEELRKMRDWRPVPLPQEQHPLPPPRPQARPKRSLVAMGSQTLPQEDPLSSPPVA